MKILHLSIDNKFIDHAIFLFEKAFPEKNDVFIFSKFTILEYVKIVPKRVVLLKRSVQGIPKIAKSEYKKYDLVIFHSYDGILYPEIFNIPSTIPTAWLGWGYDYYDLIGSPESLLLSESAKLSTRYQRTKIRFAIRSILRFSFELLGIWKSRKKAIERLTIFSPVLPNEYNLVKRALKWESFPECAQWNYGTIEDHLIKGFEGEQVNDSAILIGNSASLTCNHLECFEFIKKVELDRRRIVVPLSYGDISYGQKIAELGLQYFGKDFDPLMNFMPIQDYVGKIRNCGYVIMNQKRQQAVGNIIIMLYLGARVFIREENPTYPFFLEMGVSLSSVQELEKNPALLSTPLTAEERQKNRRLVSDYWSRERGIERTKSLVRQALALKGVTKKNRAYGELTG